ncbi:hypothetical protein NEOLEDRAFT_1030645, partial [Neolentinus lepideus HHB14362 ss-1]
LEDIRLAKEFIKLLKTAKLDDSTHAGLSADELTKLRNPPENELDLSDPGLRLSLDIYLAVQNASEQTYHSVRDAVHQSYPDAGVLSYDQVKRRVAELSGVFPILFHMCVNSCIAYTGPWHERESCPYCSEPRYDSVKSRPNKKVPRREFYTIPISRQLQALFRTRQSAEAMRYRQ